MNQERIYSILLSPHVSEKAAGVAGKYNQYVFRVAKNSNIREIHKAVETLFKVKVSSVQTLNVKGKVKRNRHGLVNRPDWKKAYVLLEPGNDIDFTSIG